MRIKIWTKEKCKEEALKYNTKKDFRKNSSSAYSISLKNKWLNYVCEHMIKMKNEKGFWTKEKCKEEALKYNNRTEFQKKSNSAYSASLKNRWLDDICSFMLPIKSKKGYWSKEKCEEEALKYRTKIEFIEFSNRVYRAALKKDWIDDICKHMLPIGNIYERCIYSIEFEDNHVYIGLTCNLRKRFNNHINDNTDNKGVVIEHIRKTGLKPILNQISNYINVNKASLLERYEKEKYEKNGWFILNKIKCGGLGSNILIWSKEKCREEALKYSNRREFREKSSSVYSTAVKNKWLNDICFHMENNGYEFKKMKGFWSKKENCIFEALKYNTKTDFKKYSQSAYQSSIKNKWLNEICKHMSVYKRPKIGSYKKKK